MLMIEETKEKFGYDPSTLSKGSVKKIIVQCDYCGTVREMKNQTRNEGLKSYPKDACKKCVGKKTKESLMEKYGVTTTQALPEVQAKTRATNLEKFGNEHFFGSQIGKEMAREGMLEKYGVEHNIHVEEFRKKRDQTVLDKYGVDNVFKLQSFQDLAIERRIEKGSIKTFNGKMIKDIARENGYAYSSMVERINKLGIDIATFEKKQESSLELKMSTILDEIGVQYEKQFRVNGKIADFRINDSNVLVEADGLYWHSDAGDKEDDYHVKKREVYDANGYRALFFREDEIIKKTDIVKSIIINTIGKSTRLYARKLRVNNVDFKTANEFVEKHHLMGGSNNVSDSFALLDEDEIVSVLQVKNLGEDEYDIARFCTAPNHSIVGGFSKLLAHFVRERKPRSVRTFIDLRYGKGDYLPGLGFKKISQHASFKWTDGEDTYHRLRFPGNSGYAQGLFKIWDCGQAKFVYTLID